MQFYLTDNCQRILIKIMDVETKDCITLWHDQVLKLINQINQFDKIDIHHPDSCYQESQVLCSAFSLRKNQYSSKIVIMTTNCSEEICLDDPTINNLSMFEINFKSIIEGLLSKL